MRSRQRGFTLIELIVVITLISIMMFFAVPRLNTNLLSSEKRRVSQWIVLTVNSLKENAVRDQQDYLLCADPDENKLWTAVEKQAPGGAGEPEREKIKEFKIPEGWNLTDAAFPGRDPRRSGVAVIRFYKKGYSDKAMLHVEDDSADRITYEIRPFLKQVKIHEKYAEF